ncbi:MAG: tetratricopeptide repeat-containing sensor histidine kinase [Sphingobacteriales bacterium]|nr:tetratricopeptide repeat-containing sensor histidine kinase [Sphingobacteriales bacterium]
MRIHKKNTFLFSINYIHYFSFSVFFLLFISCKNNPSTDLNHRIAKYNKLQPKFYEVEALKGRNALFKFLDSLDHTDYAKDSLYQLKKNEYLAFIYQADKSLDSAKFYANQLLPIIEKIGTVAQMPRDYSSVYFLLSDVNFSAGDYLEAYKWLYQGKKISEEYVDDCIESQFNYQLGNLFYKQGNFSKAKDLYQEAFNQSENCDSNFRSFYRRQEVLDNVALCYLNLKQADQAIIKLKEVLNFLELNEHRFPTQKQYFLIARGVIYGNMGQAYLLKKNYAQAQGLLEESIRINLLPKYDFRDAVLEKIHLGNLYLKINNLDAYQKLSQTLENDLKDSINLRDKAQLQADFYKLNSDYFFLKNDTSQAFKYLKLNYDLMNDIRSKKKAITQTSIEQQLKNIENQSNYELLKKRDTTKSIYLTTSIVIITMALAMMILIYWSWRKSNKTVAILKSLHEKIQLQAEELKDQNREKDKILRVVAHDLRNPIGGIYSVAKIMKMEGLEAKDEEMVNLIENTSQDALTLINEILEFTNGDLKELEKEKVHVHQLLNNTVALLRFKTDEKQQKLILNNTAIDVYVHANREKISRVLNNLIINASKFSKEEKTITISTQRDEQFLTISIQDEGMGIPAHVEKQIFEPFSSFKRTGTSGEKSFGMGLSISKQIIEAHDGKIWFERLENGTIFYVKLPLA